MQSLKPFSLRDKIGLDSDTSLIKNDKRWCNVICGHVPACSVGERFGKGWVVTEYADLLVISSSLFLALRSDSLASCRSCFSWSASFALRRIDSWVTHSRFEPFEVDTVLGTPKHKFSWKWKNGCSDQQKIETFTGTKSNSYPSMHANRMPHTK